MSYIGPEDYRRYFQGDQPCPSFRPVRGWWPRHKNEARPHACRDCGHVGGRCFCFNCERDHHVDGYDRCAVSQKGNQ